MTESPDFFDPRRISVRRSMLLLAGGALTGLLIAGVGLFTSRQTRSGGVPPEAVALVNQRQILRSDFLTQTQTEFTMPFAQTTEQQRRKVLQDMVNEELTVQRGLEIDLPSYDPGVRNALVAGVELEVTADVLATQPTPQELRAYFDAHKDRYSSEGVMQLRDLVVGADAVEPRESAFATGQRAVAALRNGQALEAVIRQFRLVDSGRFMDSGHVDTGDIFEFAVRAKTDDLTFRAAQPLRDGEVSDPLTLGTSVHLIAMIRHRFPVAQSFEEASNRVWTDLQTDAKARAVAANIAYLRSRADIILAPEYAK